MNSDKVTHMHAFGTNATYIDYRTYHNAQYISTAGDDGVTDGNKTAKLEKKKKMHIETTIIVASYNHVCSRVLVFTVQLMQ